VNQALNVSSVTRVWSFCPVVWNDECTLLAHACSPGQEAVPGVLRLWRVRLGQSCGCSSEARTLRLHHLRCRTRSMIARVVTYRGGLAGGQEHCLGPRETTSRAYLPLCLFISCICHLSNIPKTQGIGRSCSTWHHMSSGKHPPTKIEALCEALFGGLRSYHTLESRLMMTPACPRAVRTAAPKIISICTRTTGREI
jgi:hypothetical protein